MRRPILSAIKRAPNVAAPGGDHASARHDASGTDLAGTLAPSTASAGAMALALPTKAEPLPASTVTTPAAKEWKRSSAAPPAVSQKKRPLALPASAVTPARGAAVLGTDASVAATAAAVRFDVAAVAPHTPATTLDTPRDTYRMHQLVE